jgi:putative transposase
MIFIGQASLRRAVAEYVDHCHWERNHQAHDAPIHRRRRLGGMLNSYYCEAA